MEPSEDPSIEETIEKFAEQLRAHIDARFKQNPEEARAWLQRKLARLVRAATEEEPTSADKEEPGGTAP